MIFGPIYQELSGVEVSCTTCKYKRRPGKYPMFSKMDFCPFCPSLVKPKWRKNSAEEK